MNRSHCAMPGGLLLITYADSIRNDHDAPLKVLHQFLMRILVQTWVPSTCCRFTLLFR